MIHQGLTHTSTLKVTNADTALEMGSGDMPVLATPAMTALMENAAMLAVSDSLPEGCTTVWIKSMAASSISLSRLTMATRS